MKRRPRVQVKPNVPSKTGSAQSNSEGVSADDSISVDTGGGVSSMPGRSDHQIEASVNNDDLSKNVTDLQTAEASSSADSTNVVSVDSGYDLPTENADALTTVETVTETLSVNDAVSQMNDAIAEGNMCSGRNVDDHLAAEPIKSLDKSLNDQNSAAKVSDDVPTDSSSVPVTSARRRFTKVKPNIAQIQKNKQSFVSESRVNEELPNWQINVLTEDSVSENSHWNHDAELHRANECQTVTECSAPADGLLNEKYLLTVDKGNSLVEVDTIRRTSDHASHPVTNSKTTPETAEATSEKNGNRSLSEVGSEKHIKIPYRYKKVQPNLLLTTKSQNRSSLLSNSVIEGEEKNPQMNKETTAGASDPSTKSQHPHSTTINIGDKSGSQLRLSEDADVIDGCKSPAVPVSSSSGVSKTTHHFTKMRPNLPPNAKPKRISGDDNLSNKSKSVVEDEPFIPPALVQKKHLTDDQYLLGEGVANEESVVVLPEAAEKAAAKIIARKLKQKKKKRALENLDTPIDSTKICMRDLIYMNPVNNPMKSKSSEANQSVSVTVSSASTDPASSAPSLAPIPTKGNFAAPQLKIREDGTIGLDEASLVLERQPAKTYDDVEAIDETDMVRFGYPKKTRTRSWSKKETRKFFAALSMIGTDFFLMTNLFPGRSRAELKRKFKREEKIHQVMVETALNERRSLDMSVMAVHSSDEEETKRPKSSKSRQNVKRGPKGDKKQSPDDEFDKIKSTGGKENEPQPCLQVKTDKKRKRENEKQFGKRTKKKKSRYYEESSDEAEEEVEEVIESDEHSGDEDELHTMENVLSVHTSDEDDVEIINCMSSRPTRSGRIPKPVKAFSHIKLTDCEDSANDISTAVKNKKLTTKKKLPEVTILSPSRCSGPLSPTHFASPTHDFRSSPRVLCSPTHVPVLSPICSPSSQLSFLPGNISGLENIAPGKQLMILASPVLSNDGGEPAQQLLHVFMVSSPQFDNDCQDQVQVQSMSNVNDLDNQTENSLGTLSSGYNQESYMNRNETGVGSLNVMESSASTITGVYAQHFENSSNFDLAQVNLEHSAGNLVPLCTANQSQANISSCTGDFRLNLPSVFSGRQSNASLDVTKLETSDRMLATDTSVSPMLSNSVLEYCMSQVSGMAPVSLDFSNPGNPIDMAIEEDVELEGNITNVMQQDDGTLVIVAE